MKTATLVMCLFAVLAVSIASPISNANEVDASNVETAVKKSTEAAIQPIKTEEEKSEPTKKSTESAIDIQPVKADEEKKSEPTKKSSEESVSSTVTKAEENTKAEEENKRVARGARGGFGGGFRRGGFGFGGAFGARFLGLGAFGLLGGFPFGGFGLPFLPPFAMAGFGGFPFFG